MASPSAPRIPIRTRIGIQTMANTMRKLTIACPKPIKVAEARSTSAAGSYLAVVFVIVTRLVPNVTVSVASAAWSERVAC